MTPAAGGRHHERNRIVLHRSADFTPGMRFFFRYGDLIRHPGAVFEGVLPLKVKGEVVLRDWAAAIIAPSAHRPALEAHIPEELKPRGTFFGMTAKISGNGPKKDMSS